jgi:hypothetical protein
MIRSSPLFSSKKLFLLQIVSLAATIGVWRWFVLIGTPGRDAKGNVRSGDDLNGGGIIELAWDLYVYCLNLTEYPDKKADIVGYISLGSALWVLHC